MSVYIALERIQPEQIFQHNDLRLQEGEVYKKYIQYHQLEKSVI